MKRNTLSPSVPHRSFNVTPTSNVFRYKIGYIRDGKRYLSPDWRNNLIMAAGLNKAGNVTSCCQCFSTCLFGNNVSPVAVQRDSGVVTFTQASNVITASGGFFVAQDVGRLFKWGTGSAGTEAYITAYTSATQVTVAASPDVGVGEVGTVWYVNSASLSTVLQTTSTYGSTGGDNGTSVAANVLTHKRTFVGTAVGGATTLTEIGFSDGSTNSSIFDRDIISGGVALLTGDIPLAVAELIQTFNQTTPVTAPNVGSGCNTEGDIQLEWLPVGNGDAWSFVQTNGSTGSGSNALEPTGTGNGGVILASYSFNTFTTSTSTPTQRSQFGGNYTNGTYTAGVFQRNKNFSYSIADGNGTLYGFAMGGGSGSGTVFNAANFCSVKFDTPFVKSGSQVLTFSFTVSWQRILTN
jgi:hypothetical protein